MPPSPVKIGNDSAGRPVSVHNEQNAGLPVAMPLGATPGEAGVMMASYSLNISAMPACVAPRRVARRQIAHSGRLAALGQKIAQLLAGAIAAALDQGVEIVRHVGGHDRAMVVPGRRISCPADRLIAPVRPGARPAPRTPRAFRRPLCPTPACARRQIAAAAVDPRRLVRERPAPRSAAYRCLAGRSRPALPGSARYRPACARIPRHDRAPSTASTRRGARSSRGSACSHRRRKRPPGGSPSRWSASRWRAAPCRPPPPPPSPRTSRRACVRDRADCASRPGENRRIRWSPSCR